MLITIGDWARGTEEEDCRRTTFSVNADPEVKGKIEITREKNKNDVVVYHAVAKDTDSVFEVQLHRQYHNFNEAIALIQDELRTAITEAMSENG